MAVGSLRQRPVLKIYGPHFFFGLLPSHSRWATADERHADSVHAANQDPELEAAEQKAAVEFPARMRQWAVESLLSVLGPPLLVLAAV